MLELATSDEEELARILEERMQEAFDRFVADIPQILRSMPARAVANESSDATDFVRALLEWVARASPRSHRARAICGCGTRRRSARRGTRAVPGQPS